MSGGTLLVFHPAWLRESPSFVTGLNLLDEGLTALLPVFAQNWFFVLRKRGMAAAGGSPLDEQRSARILNACMLIRNVHDPKTAASHAGNYAFLRVS